MRDDGETPPAPHRSGEVGDRVEDYASIHAFRLDSTGLRRVLGPLEADVIEAVWRLTPESDHEVHEDEDHEAPGNVVPLQ